MKSKGSSPGTYVWEPLASFTIIQDLTPIPREPSPRSFWAFPSNTALHLLAAFRKFCVWNPPVCDLEATGSLFGQQGDFSSLLHIMSRVRTALSLCSCRPTLRAAPWSRLTQHGVPTTSVTGGLPLAQDPRFPFTLFSVNFSLFNPFLFKIFPTKNYSYSHSQCLPAPICEPQRAGGIKCPGLYFAQNEKKEGVWWRNKWQGANVSFCKRLSRTSSISNTSGTKATVGRQGGSLHSPSLVRVYHLHGPHLMGFFICKAGE